MGPQLGHWVLSLLRRSNSPGSSKVFDRRAIACAIRRASRSDALFTDRELEYLQSQRLARIATVSGDEQPDLARWLQFRRRIVRHRRQKQSGNVQVQERAGRPPEGRLCGGRSGLRVPLAAAGRQIHGAAEIVARQEGYAGPGEYLRVRPARKWSWGL